MISKMNKQQQASLKADFCMAVVGWEHDYVMGIKCWQNGNSKGPHHENGMNCEMELILVEWNEA